MFSAPIRTSGAKTVTDMDDLSVLLQVIVRNGVAPPETHRLWVQATLEREKNADPTAYVFEPLEAELLAIFGPEEANDAA